MKMNNPWPSTDTISEMLPGDLDVVAWDFRKFLQHMNKSNASVLEWLGSPIVYMDNGLLDRLNALKFECTEPAHIAFHYAAMFNHAMENKTDDGTISVKKLCYALRAALCVQWTLEKGTMPPTAFEDVRAGLSLEPMETDAIDRLLERKASSRESDRIVPAPELGGLLRDRSAELKSVYWSHRMSDDAVAQLTQIFRTCVKNQSLGNGFCENSRIQQRSRVSSTYRPQTPHCCIHPIGEISECQNERQSSSFLCSSASLR